MDTAANGQLALAQLQERPYDLILSDLRMPELDGPGLYRALEQHAPQLCRRFIVLTGDSLSPETEAFVAQSGVQRLTKPFTAAAGSARHSAGAAGWVSAGLEDLMAAMKPPTMGAVGVVSQLRPAGALPPRSHDDEHDAGSHCLVFGTTFHGPERSDSMLHTHGRYAYSNITERPDYSWPGGKRLAVYVAVNIEQFR